MEVEIRNIFKANLKRIDPKLHSKIADLDGEVESPDSWDDMAQRNPCTDQGVDLTHSGKDMQVDNGGDASTHLM